MKNISMLFAVMLFVQFSWAEQKISTMHAHADIYNKTHTCDLDKLSGGWYESTKLNCLYADGASPPEKIEVQLNAGSMRWVFYRNGRPSYDSTERVEYLSAPNNKGLCTMRTLHGNMGCNNNVCRTLLYFGMNNETNELDMVILSKRMMYCRGAKKGQVEQLVQSLKK